VWVSQTKLKKEWKQDKVTLETDWNAHLSPTESGQGAAVSKTNEQWLLRQTEEALLHVVAELQRKMPVARKKISNCLW
jgi:hypothetical protein